MKKLIALVCTVVMLCSIAGTALANGSIDELLVDPIVDVVIMIVSDPEPGDDWNDLVKDIVSFQDSSDDPVPVIEYLKYLVELPSNSGRFSIADNTLLNSKPGFTPASTDLTNLSVVGDFTEVDVYDGDKRLDDLSGKDLSGRIKLKYKQLIGLQAKDVKVLFIEPKSGQMELMPVEEKDFDSKQGTITVNPPASGIVVPVVDETKLPVPEKSGETDAIRVEFTPSFASTNADSTESNGDWRIEILPLAVPDIVWLTEIADLVRAINEPSVEKEGDEPKEITTVEKFVATLLSLSSPKNEGKTLEEGTLEVPGDEESSFTYLPGFDFASSFSLATLTNGVIVRYDDNGKPVSFEVTLKYEQLKGRKASDFRILLVEPETGEFTIIELNPDKFDPNTGEITVKFPFLGTFALIEKIK